MLVARRHDRLDRRCGECPADDVDAVDDLDGALVTPAFVDAHVHATSTGITLTGLDLATSRSACARRSIGWRRTAGRDAGASVIGHGWDETHWPEQRPTAAQRAGSSVVRRRGLPVPYDVHSAVVSSALLAAAPADARARRLRRPATCSPVRRITSRGPSRRQPSPGRIALRPSAPPAHGQRSSASAASTSWPDPTSPAPTTSSRMLELAAAEPGPDVVGYWGELGGADRARELGAVGAGGDLFADGALGSHTAYLRTVYEDADHRGTAYLTAAQVRDHVLACVDSGLQAGFHAIGDGALETVVAGFEEAAAARRRGSPASRPAPARTRRDGRRRAGCPLAELGVVGQRSAGIRRRLGRPRRHVRRAARDERARSR